jgi:hypothetical protein
MQFHIFINGYCVCFVSCGLNHVALLLCLHVALTYSCMVIIFHCVLASVEFSVSDS